MDQHPVVAGQRRWMAAVMTACILATLTVLAGDAGANAVVGPADPSAVQLTPAPGEVVPAGRVSVSALLWTSAGVRSAELRVDGRSLPGLSAGTFAAEVDPTTGSLVKMTGRPVHCVRPPYGAYDREVVTRLAGRGLHTALWTVDTRDWTRPGADTIVRTVLDGLHPGAVILFHDGGGDRSQTVAALPRILEGIRAAGYRIAVLCG